MTRRSQTFATAVIRRDKTCQDCGEVKNLQAHHIIPMGAGGSDTIDNGEALCPGCHADRHPDVPRGLFFKSSGGKIVASQYNSTTLAAKLGCHPRTITRAAKKLNIKRVGGSWSFYDSDVAAIESIIQKKSDRPKKPKREKAGAPPKYGNQRMVRLNARIPPAIRQQLIDEFGSIQAAVNALIIEPRLTRGETSK